jgi:hypothetical protein
MLFEKKTGPSNGHDLEQACLLTLEISLLLIPLFLTTGVVLLKITSVARGLGSVAQGHDLLSNGNIRNQ